MMNTLLDQLKAFAERTLMLLRKFDSILISLVVLMLFGFALLRINDAVDPTPTTEALNQAQLEQTTTQVRYDKKAIEKIKELVNIESNIKASKEKHQKNPFEL